MASRITAESRCLELNGYRLTKEIHCQSSGSKLFIDLWIPFYMDLFHNDRNHYNTTQPMFLHFTTEAKPVHTLCSQIQNISRSLRKSTSRAKSWRLYCLLVRKKGIGTFILLYISHLFCGKISWEKPDAKSNADIYNNQHISRAITALHGHFQTAVYLHWLTDQWLNSFQTPPHNYQCAPLPLCTAVLRKLHSPSHVQLCEFPSAFPLLYFQI